MEYKGIKYNTLEELLKDYNVSISNYYRCKKLGIKLEEILENHKRKDKVYDHLGNEFDSIKEMCKEWGISYCWYHKGVKEGKDLKDILTTKPTERGIYVDHLGNVYKNQDDMCNYYGIDRHTLRNNIKKGYTLEEILTKRKFGLSYGERVISKILYEKGLFFQYNKSIKDLFNETNNDYSRTKIDFTIYKEGKICKCIEFDGEQHFNNKHIHKTDEDYIKLIKNDDLKNEYLFEKRIPLLRIRYDQQDKIVEILNIFLNNEVYTNRINPYLTNKQYYTKRMILNKRLLIKNKANYEIKDHLGNSFECVNDMCKHYGISKALYRYRIKNGYTKEEALTLKKSRKSNLNQKRNPTIDHLGNEFESFTDMCKKYSLNPTTVTDRLNRGLSLGQALTKPLAKNGDNRRKKSFDHLGNEYISITEMCKCYNIETSIYCKRIKRGWSVKEALLGRNDN